MNAIRLLALGIGLATGLATAQPATSDPSRPEASAPPLRYRSAFSDYRPLDDTGPGDWKASNVRVTQAAAARMPQAAPDTHDDPKSSGMPAAHAHPMPPGSTK